MNQRFEPRHALTFVAIVGAILLLSAGVHRWLGDTGVVLAAGVAGFADAHAAAASVAQRVASAQITPAHAGWAVLVALAANSASKLLMAWLRGGGGYCLRIVPGVVAILAAFAAGVWWRG